MNKWHFRFLDLAKLVGSWSKDPTTKVGSVIVDGHKRIVSLGYNGPPVGVEEAIDRDKKLLRTIHAEVNALHFASRSVDGCAIYVTHPPCAHCAGHIIQRGIKTVVFPVPPADFLERWESNYNEAMKMFTEAGVAVEVVS